MTASADRVIMEVHLLNQEILRLDTMAKQRITAISQSINDERRIIEEVKELKMLLVSLRNKINSISGLVHRLPSRSEQLKLTSEVERHSKELEENTKQMRIATVTAKKRISESARKNLINDSYEGRRKETDQMTLKENATKATEKLSDLVLRMSQQVTHSEQTMDSLVHSSNILAQTHNEYDAQSSHIQTGSKLLSKYERRELTDKILITLAMICYFLVIYYILQKRVFSKFWFF